MKPRRGPARLFPDSRIFGVNKMKKQPSDEQLDTLMRSLLKKAAADDATVNEIADSPAIWWGVQRQINEQKSAALLAWPPVGKVLRWLMVGVPVAAAAALMISFFIFRPAETSDYVANSVTQPRSTAVVNTPSSMPIVDSPSIATKVVQNSAKHEKHEVVAAKISRDIKHTGVRPEVTTAMNIKNLAEIKTEFIALSYARDPESGQIVRVKVPSSMMVSLGLVGNVKAPSELVDAEVLVGDDGLTRAIRFIR